MQFQVLPCQQLKEFLNGNIKLKTVIISITDYGSISVVFTKNDNINLVLNLQFNDVEYGENNSITTENPVCCYKTYSTVAMVFNLLMINLSVILI